jgi:preprotein translocase subunit SecF
LRISASFKNKPLTLFVGDTVGIKSGFLHVYDKHYKKLLVLSFLLLFACIGVLITHKMQTGEFISKGVSLKGGLTITIPATQADVHSLQSSLSSQFPTADINVRSIAEAGELKALIVEASDVNEDELVQALKNNGVQMVQGEYSVETMGSSLGESFYKQTIIAVLLAFLFMSLVVFVTFRNLLPSSFVILCAVSDILSTIAAIDFLGVKLSTAGVAALLMLIGYSVDTDILLTTKVLKRKEGSIFHRTVDTMRTGMLMSLTAFGASMVGYFYTQSDVVKQIMLIISIGMVFDMIYTWVQNAGILRWYLETKEGGQHGQA